MEQYSVTGMSCAAAMSLSSFSVVTNALRLNLFDLHSADRDHRAKPVDIDDVIDSLSAKDDVPARPEGI